MLRKFWLLFIVIFSILEAKPPQISPKDVKNKVDHILESHATIKEITPSLVERILKNFIDELDPAKQYFLESDIEKWIYPTEALTNKVMSGFKYYDFKLFEKIHDSMVDAISRREGIEKDLESRELPQNVDKEEFKDIKWANSKEELTSRLLKIKSLQLEAAQKLDNQTKDQFIQRLKKRRISRESELLGKSLKERKMVVLSYVLKATASSLDSHTNYFTPSEATQFMIQVQQRLFGIGAELRDDLNGFTIVRIVEKGPAGMAKKLKINDRIIAVDGIPVVGMDIIDAVELIRGEKGSKVKLTVLRKNSEDIKKELKKEIVIVRGEVVLEDSRLETSFEPYGDGIIAYLKLFSFYQDPSSSSTNDLKKAIEKYKKDGTLKGIVLDLRNNAGGILPQAVGVTGLFITKGIVVSIKDNEGKVKHLRDTDGKVYWDGPLVVLTNRASASAAEIVAQTLQD